MTLRELAHRVPYHHEVYVLGLTLLGRNRCGLVQSLRENGIYRRKHEAAIASIAARSRVLERDSDRLVLIDTPYGQYWTPAGMDLFSPLAERAIELYLSTDHSVRGGDIVLDCGANVGVFAREALDRGGSRVVVIEPSPLNVECLRRNFERDIADGRVIVVSQGLWDEETTLKFSVAGNSVRDSFVLESGDTRATLQLRVTTIDKLCRDMSLARVDFIKMDIEGAEQRALAGAQETLARHHPRLSLASYHKADDFENIPRIVRQAWPDCRIAHGPCKSTFGHVQPETLYFSHS
jgi:FkbM family methyltransferase